MLAPYPHVLKPQRKWSSLLPAKICMPCWSFHSTCFQSWICFCFFS